MSTPCNDYRGSSNVGYVCVCGFPANMHVPEAMPWGYSPKDEGKPIGDDALTAARSHHFQAFARLNKSVDYERMARGIYKNARKRSRKAQEALSIATADLLRHYERITK